MVYGEMKEEVHRHRTKVTIHRQLRNTDFDQLNHELQEALWHMGEIFTDVDDKYDYWTALFKYTVNAHLPIKRKRVCEKDIPYMTSAWKKTIRNKRKHAILFAKNRMPENMELKRKYRNIATREQRKAIMEYWFAKSEELKSKPREFYNAFRPFINSKTKESTSISLKTEEGIVVKDQCEVAEQLLNYCTTAAVSIIGDNAICITEENHDNHGSIKALREAYLGTHFEFNHVSKDQVQKGLENINPNKSCGWDPGAPPKLLKNVACGIAPSLMTLYNSCIKLGQWPCVWKMGEWTPVFKKETDSWRRTIVPSRPLLP